MSMSMEDIFIKRMWVWILNDLGFLSLSVFRLWAARGGANWVRLGMDIRVKLDSESPVMVQVLLSVCQVLVCRDDVSIKLWSEVVVDILGWVVPLSLGGFGTELELMALHALGKLKRGVVIDDVSVNTEVWHWVVDLVTEWLLFVLVLGAASRGADWIRFNIGIELNCKGPVVTEVRLSIGEVLVGGDDVAIKLRSEVVIDILSWVVPLGLGSLGSHLEFVRFHALSKFEGSMVINDVGVDTEVWNWIVDLVSQWLLLVLVLSAAGG
jgi:hypothetical protein